jgi:hypothetical protein
MWLKTGIRHPLSPSELVATRRTPALTFPGGGTLLGPSDDARSTGRVSRMGLIRGNGVDPGSGDEGGQVMIRGLARSSEWVGKSTW